MMWLKIVSVWVATRLGFNVLFQDADLVSTSTSLFHFNHPMS